MLLKLGKKVSGEQDQTGYRRFYDDLPAKGFPLSYNASDNSFNCPGHYSRFDAEQVGSRFGATRLKTFRNTRCV